ncbi:putative lysosome-related organelles biogenesis complex 1 protein [Chloropicon primus]|uniref:Putative lysosome-related organelles biogenesis complex 1 protein n=1 Tax=Chloropicon primus TaxID=1764295 RepID=A0A5B8MWS7_9CHLO|nr:putative lysosome-related organelles biogenesis complex 1 protein [Chloropicon primus]UPR04202.1 putative lysosome-related organelles biogenesis complex 1 protein [Chloropicon primus]|eukprot:QDZ24993.1 putative lysosome-related organelles biogenesis complex 1 protein [Chloropicon primus]
MVATAVLTLSSPWDSYHRLWLDLLQADNASPCVIYNAYAGDVPSLRELKEKEVETLCVVGVDCGSNNWSALRENEWASKVVRAITEFLSAEEDESKRLFCCGLGSHAVAEALGCTVSRNPSTSNVGEGGGEEGERFIVEPTAVHACPALVDTIGSWLRETRTNSLSPTPRLMANGDSKVDLGSTLFLLESHSEQVSELPPSCQILASSKKTQAEIWTMGKKVLAYQCHPELTPALFRGMVLPKVAESKLSSSQATEEANSKLDDFVLDSEVLAAMARHFINGNWIELSPQRDAKKGSESAIKSMPGGGGASGLSPLLQDGRMQQGGDSVSAVQLDGVLETAKKMFNSVAQAIRGEFKIPQMEYELLGKMNKVASEKYNHMADFTAGLSVFVESLREKEESLQPLASQIDGLENQLNELESLVLQLDEYSKRLENRVKKYVFS